MGYMTNGLAFNVLRGGNRARLPQFKNSKGEPAHCKHDGSDWSPAQWLQAVVGELGEWAQCRKDYEDGIITRAEYQRKSAKELADVQTYLDILALRSYDELETYNSGISSRVMQGHPFVESTSQVLMSVVALLGTYANDRKKLERGDYTFEQYKDTLMTSSLVRCVSDLHREAHLPFTGPHRGDFVAVAHPQGVNLGQATMDKFNEVSERVGSTVRIDAEDWHYVKNTPPAANRRKD